MVTFRKKNSFSIANPVFTEVSNNVSKQGLRQTWVFFYFASPPNFFAFSWQKLWHLCLSQKHSLVQ